MTNTRILGLLLASAAYFVESPNAQVPAQATASGKITALFADPSDFVVELDSKGKCGSGYFHVQRANVNFKEMTAVALTAFSADKTITFFVASCSGDRNIVSHGFVSR